MIELDGSGSYDPDGDPLSYWWTTGCPGATIDNPSDVSPLLRVPTPLGSPPVNCTVELYVSDRQDSSRCTSSVAIDSCGTIGNRPPVCDAGGPYAVECQGATTSIQLDGSGSFDPDPGDALTFAWSSECPGASFDDTTSATPVLTIDTPCCEASCTVMLTVSDGLSYVTCVAEVNVTGEPPTPGDALVLWPPNHKYVTIEPSDCVLDVCNGVAPPVSIYVLSASSDEPEDVQGNGDGSTLQDIVIECPATVHLRAERQGKGNGRVYTILYEITDAAGQVRQVACHISVPHDQSGDPAVEDLGTGYTVTASCGGPTPVKRTTVITSAAEHEGLRLVRDPDRGIGIEFSLQSQSSVAIDVYDISGRRVRSMRSVQPAGIGTVYWDGRNASGREVAVGIYLFKFQAAGVTQSAKALWMR